MITEEMRVKYSSKCDENPRCTQYNSIEVYTQDQETFQFNFYVLVSGKQWDSGRVFWLGERWIEDWDWGILPLGDIREKVGDISFQRKMDGVFRFYFFSVVGVIHGQVPIRYVFCSI